MPSPLTALSPLDGRYARTAEPLRPYFSEQALIRYRVRIELAWLEALAAERAIRELKPLLAEDRAPSWRGLLKEFSERDAEHIKNIEAETNHDVKAIEYWLREQARRRTPRSQRALEFIHFACTSEDINNLAYALMVRESRDEVMLPALDAAGRGAEAPRARARGACRCSRAPTARPRRRPRSARRWRTSPIACERAREPHRRGAGAGQDRTARSATTTRTSPPYPDFDWERFGRRFVERLGPRIQPATRRRSSRTTALAELLDAYARANTIAARPRPRPLGLHLARLLPAEDEEGRGRLLHHAAQGEPDRLRELRGQPRLANALLRHLADKLPVSRWQRDLSDSTVLRNVGVALGHSLLAYDSCLRGLGKLEADPRAPRRRPRGELGSARRGGAAGDAPPRRARGLREAEGASARQARSIARSSPPS